MPSLDTARRIAGAKYNGVKTIGQMYKENSDFVMENTWMNDIQSKTCYIYDYLHDDQPELKDHMTYENTIKTKIDAKFIISSYGSVDKDQVAYHIMFKPSEPIEFNEGDELYYYETDYRKRYNMRYPVGLFIDIPDENGIYVKWLIVDFEESNQFMKYIVLPCDYRFQWISVENGKRYKQYMWGSTRAMNSYTSGVYTDRYFSSLDDINKIWLPLNKVTEKIDYLNGDGKSQRMIISAKIPHPLTWQISKIENTKPIGIAKITLKQAPFNDDTDKIEYDEDGNITDMWADYYSTNMIEPVDSDEDIPDTQYVGCYITCSSETIKIGGSYRTFTAHYYNADKIDVSDVYKEFTHDWRFFIEDSNGERIDEIVTVQYDENDNNVIKVKFPNDRKYLNKHLFIDLYTNAYIYGSGNVMIIG